METARSCPKLLDSRVKIVSLINPPKQIFCRWEISKMTHVERFWMDPLAPHPHKPPLMQAHPLIKNAALSQDPRWSVTVNGSSVPHWGTEKKETFTSSSSSSLHLIVSSSISCGSKIQQKATYFSSLGCVTYVMSKLLCCCAPWLPWFMALWETQKAPIVRIASPSLTIWGERKDTYPQLVGGLEHFFLIFPYIIGNSTPNWLIKDIYFRGVGQQTRPFWYVSSYGPSSWRRKSYFAEGQFVNWDHIFQRTQMFHCFGFGYRLVSDDMLLILSLILIFIMVLD